MLGIPIIDTVLNIGGKIIDRVWPDPTERAKAKLELMKMAQQGQLKDLEAAMNVIVAEAKSEHWITAAWRPLTMLSFVAIVVNNYIVGPYIGALFGFSITLPIPPDMWALLKLGIGGYVVGRSVEKGIQSWKNGNKD